MSDLSVTPANVLPGAGASTDSGMSGAAITAGQPIYKASGGALYPTDADSATVDAREMDGIALNSAPGAGQPVTYMKPGGEITIGATMTAGVTYYLSGTAGGICPLADVGATEYLSIVGIAKSTTVLKTVAGGYSGVLGA
jgi:hypothetical protein